MKSMLLFCLINRHLSSFEMRSHINESIYNVYTKTQYLHVIFLSSILTFEQNDHFSFVRKFFFASPPSSELYKLLDFWQNYLVCKYLYSYLDDNCIKNWITRKLQNIFYQCYMDIFYSWNSIEFNNCYPQFYPAIKTYQLKPIFERKWELIFKSRSFKILQASSSFTQRWWWQTPVKMIRHG